MIYIFKADYDGTVRGYQFDNIKKSQLSDWLENGVLIQNALPQLTPDEREFLITGDLIPGKEPLNPKECIPGTEILILGDFNHSWELGVVESKRNKILK